jgi:hypothetical protein
LDHYFEQTVTLSGTGSAWDSEELPIRDGHSGVIKEVKVRQNTGGGATAADVYIVHSDTAVSATPDGLLCAFAYTSLALTASATALSLSQPIASGGVLRRDLGKQVAVNVTGSGAWTIYVTVSYERKA